jgi:hypothetical protein
VRRRLKTLRLRIRRSWVLPAVAMAGTLLLVSAGGIAAVETDIVPSYARGLWWSISLMTTVGFVGQPPRTAAGAVLSVILMLAGFVLLALVSAALASLFVREDEQPYELREQMLTAELLEEVRALRSEVAALRDPSEGR